MSDTIVSPRSQEEDAITFGARVAQALRVEEVEVRLSPDGDSFVVPMGRELRIDEILELQKRIEFNLGTEFDLSPTVT